jgi:hypothetical protein
MGSSSTWLHWLPRSLFVASVAVAIESTDNSGYRSAGVDIHTFDEMPWRGSIDWCMILFTYPSGFSMTGVPPSLSTAWDDRTPPKSNVKRLMCKMISELSNAEVPDFKLTKLR